MHPLWAEASLLWQRYFSQKDGRDLEFFDSDEGDDSRFGLNSEPPPTPMGFHLDPPNTLFKREHTGDFFKITPEFA